MCLKVVNKVFVYIVCFRRLFALAVSAYYLRSKIRRFHLNCRRPAWHLSEKRQMIIKAHRPIQPVSLIIFNVLFEIVLQFLASARMSELAQGFRFNLADPFTCDVEFRADLLERMRMTAFKAETQTEHLSLSCREGF